MQQQHTHCHVANCIEESSDVEQTEHGIETLQPPRKPTSKDYAMHCLTVFWRVVFAFIPPEGICSADTHYYIIHCIICT